MGNDQVMKPDCLRDLALRNETALDKCFELWGRRNVVIRSLLRETHSLMCGVDEKSLEHFRTAAVVLFPSTIL